MTTNFRKIWGILFLATMTVVSAPNGAWGQKLEENAKIEAPDEFVRNKGMTELADSLKALKDGEKEFFARCGDDASAILCDTRISKCIACSHSSLSQGGGQSYNAGGEIITTTDYRCIPQNEEASAYNEYKERSAFNKWATGMTDPIKIKECVDAPNSGKGAVNIDQAIYNTLKKYECMKDSSGNEYCLSVHGKDFTINYANGEGGFKNCEVLPVKLYNQRKCFFCPLFQVLFRAADNMATISFQKLGNAFKALIGVGLALWIAVQTLSHVSSLTKQDAPKFLGGLINQSFKFLIAFLLLANSQQIYTKFVTPVLEAGLAFGGALVSSNLDISDKEIREISNIVDPGAHYLTNGSESLYPSIAVFIAKVQYKIAFMQAVGSSLVCVGGHGMLVLGNEVDFGDGFQMAITGILLAVFGLLLSLAFAFYLIDAVVQLGIVGALMPFLIACWPFKLTAGYTKKGVEIILNSFFVFVFLGLVITANLELVSAGLQNSASPTTTTETNDQTKANDKAENKKNDKANNDTLGGLLPIYNAINGQKNDELKKLTDISTTGFLILLACCIFGFKLSGKAEELAGKMSGGAISGIGSSIGTMAASAVTSGARKVTAPLRKAAGEKIGRGASAIARAPVAGARALFRLGKGKKPSGSGPTPTVGGGGRTPPPGSGPIPTVGNSGSESTPTPPKAVPTVSGRQATEQSSRRTSPPQPTPTVDSDTNPNPQSTPSGSDRGASTQQSSGNPRSTATGSSGDASTEHTQESSTVNNAHTEHSSGTIANAESDSTVGSDTNTNPQSTSSGSDRGASTQQSSGNSNPTSHTTGSDRRSSTQSATRSSTRSRSRGNDAPSKTQNQSHSEQQETSQRSTVENSRQAGPRKPIPKALKNKIKIVNGSAGNKRNLIKKRLKSRKK